MSVWDTIGSIFKKKKGVRPGDRIPEGMSPMTSVTAGNTNSMPMTTQPFSMPSTNMGGGMEYRNPMQPSGPYAGSQPSGTLSKIGGFVRDVAPLAGVVTGAIAAGKEGKARDREQEWREKASAEERELERKRQEDARIMAMIQAMSSGL